MQDLSVIGPVNFAFASNSTLASLLKEKLPHISRFVLLTDTNLSKIYASPLLNQLRENKIEVLLKVIPSGEESKSRKTKAEVEDWMLINGLGRDTCILALGGGVVGDLSGYIAATYMRGIPFIQIPTTLLAMVDSSIGGKTGIDTPAGKNLLGAFHHPRFIYYDPSYLKTLPKREFYNGMAEVIKTAAIRDEPLFELLERNADSVLGLDQEILLKIIRRCATIKAEVVAEDEREAGVRCILNFGHTIGHAIEALLTPKFLHGECVSIGMVLECELANIMGLLRSSHTTGRIMRLCQLYYLPVALPKSLKPTDIMQKMGLDKKNIGKRIRCVILKAVGNVMTEPVPVEASLLKRLFYPYISLKPSVVNGIIEVPGSKSLSNRILLLCALAKGKCKLYGLLHADDTDVMLDALNKLGVKFEWQNDGQVLAVEGVEGKFAVPTKPFYLGNAGTASRFLTTMCFLVNGVVTLTGCDRLCERPMEDLVESLSANGCQFKFLAKEGCIPFEVHGNGFPGGEINLSASVSSQFVSSILISAPYAKNQVKLITKEEVSKQYIDMTTAIMKKFGIEVTESNGLYVVPQGHYVNPPEVYVEADASSASYPLAMAAITGGDVTVNNIGSNSLQGDSKFYTVLGKMGCTVSQTETSTTVKGPPGGLLKAVEVDMASMTDTFMTIAVVAVCAEGTTKITNIANQRVKECNRIAVMVEELGKCGVKASELPDGIQIEGCGANLSHLHGASINCHKDHRIAMSFAVLGLRVPDIVITDRECVNKTYPEFWNDLEKIFNVPLIIPDETQANTQSQKDIDGNSVIIIGMRGSGKSTMGKKLSEKLGWEFVDLDDIFEKYEGCTIKQFIEKGNTWEQFREKESNILKKVVSEKPKKHIISCGGGVIETQETQEFLKNYGGIVLHLSRNDEDVTTYLKSDSTRPLLAEEPEKLIARRTPLYEASSKFRFYITKGENNWATTENSLYNFVKNLLEDHKSNPKDKSYFVSLTEPDLRKVADLLPEMTHNVDAVELRVDLLESLSDEFVLEQIFFLRRTVSLPIIFTVRSKEQGGSFDGNEDTYFRLVKLALKSNCEFVDIEADKNAQKLEEVINSKHNTKVIASLHDYSSSVTQENLNKLFEKCVSVKGADIVKVVAMAKELSDVHVLQQVLSSKKFNTPVISILAGEKGKLSRVLNNYLTPVTHPLLSQKAAPGQLSYNEIVEVRNILGL